MSVTMLDQQSVFTMLYCVYNSILHYALSTPSAQQYNNVYKQNVYDNE